MIRVWEVFFMEYIIQPGDTLFRIARRLGIKVDTLLRLNPGINPNRLFVGQRITIPTPPPSPVPIIPPGCIVYVSNRSGQPELWRTNGAGTGTVQITRGSGTAGQPVSNPKWSPDGLRIAYQAVGGLFVIDPCGRRPVLLASNVSNYSWSNDSRRIAFNSSGGTFITDLQGNARKLGNTVANPVWFPGDQRLAGSVGETEEIRFSHLATTDVTGANFNVIEPPVPGQIVQLSPNGGYAAAELFKGYGYGVFSTVTLYDFNIGRQIRLTGFEIPVRTDINFVHDISHTGGWSPDSSRFVYSTIMNEQGLGEIRIVNPQGTLLQKFTRSYYPIPGWSPVPEWIIYTVSEQPGTTAFDATRPRNIYVRNLNTNQEILIAGPADAHSPNWNGVGCLAC